MLKHDPESIRGKLIAMRKGTSQNSFSRSTSEKSLVAEQDQSRRIVIARQFLQSRLAASHSADLKKIPRCPLTKLMTEVEIAYHRPVFPFVKKRDRPPSTTFSATIAYLDGNDCMRERSGVAKIIACHGAIQSLFRRLPRKCLKY